MAFHCMFMLHSAYPFVHGHLTCIDLLAIGNNAIINMAIQTSACMPSFSSSGYSMRTTTFGDYQEFLNNFQKMLFMKKLGADLVV